MHEKTAYTAADTNAAVVPGRLSLMLVKHVTVSCTWEDIYILYRIITVICCENITPSKELLDLISGE